MRSILRWLAPRLALTLGLGVLPLLLAEIALRVVSIPSEGLTAFVFHTRFDVARWTFLREHRDRLLLRDAARARPNIDVLRYDPEPDRPPFDRVVVRYRVRTNAEAYRDAPFDRLVAPSSHRIVFFGDSVTFGRGVDREDRWTDRLLAALGPGFAGYNFGVLGCTSRCMRARLERAMELHPDFVVLQASANDVDQALYLLAERHEAALPLSIDALEVLVRFRLPLYLAYLLGGDPHDAQRRRGTEAARKLYKDALDELFGACRKRGIPLLVVDVPFATGERYAEHVVQRCRAEPEVCLGVSTVRFSAADLPTGPRDLTVDGPDWAGDTARLAGLDEGALRRVLPHDRLFFDIVHPNVHGNRVIASTVLADLRRLWEPARAR